MRRFDAEREEGYVKPMPMARARVLWKVNRHWLHPAGRLLVTAPLMLGALIVALALADGLGRQGWLVSLLLAMAIAGAWFAAPMIGWASTSLTLTDRSVIVETGAFRYVHTAIPYDRIQAVDVRQNLAGRVFGYGTVKLGVVMPGGPVTISHVPLRGAVEELSRRVTVAVARDELGARNRRAM